MANPNPSKPIETAFNNQSTNL